MDRAGLKLRLAPLGWKRGLAVAAAALILLLIAAAFVWRDDILRTALDPKEPFQVYAPPPAPDYAQTSAWALLPARSDPVGAALPADVFFVHPTTYDGGPHWNAPITEDAPRRQLERVMLPNQAGPFLDLGRVFAPRYRQASLYAYLTGREDAQDARRFAYGDVERAFRLYLARYNQGRPFVIVGVEQGGFLADRLVRQVVAGDPVLTRKMAAAYLIRTVVAAEAYAPDRPVPACRAPGQAHCVVAFAAAPETGGEHTRELLERSLVWSPDWALESLEGRAALCVNPITGAQDAVVAPAASNLGAANATGMEWGVRPGVLPRQVSAQCDGGVLKVSRPKSTSLRPAGPWADRLKVPPYNVFFADLEADAMKRVATALGRADFPRAAPPIERSLQRID